MDWPKVFDWPVLTAWTTLHHKTCQQCHLSCLYIDPLLSQGISNYQSKIMEMKHQESLRFFLHKTTKTHQVESLSQRKELRITRENNFCPGIRFNCQEVELVKGNNYNFSYQVLFLWSHLFKLRSWCYLKTTNNASSLPQLTVSPSLSLIQYQVALIQSCFNILLLTLNNLFSFYGDSFPSTYTQ